MKTQRTMLTLISALIFIPTAFCQQNARQAHYYNPCFSPDGSSIVFESTRDGKASIYTMDPDGSDLKKITDTIYDYGQPAWSPDGKNLVYYGSNRPMQLFTNTRNGGNQKMLPTPGFDAYEPSWSSQNTIAFDSRALGQNANDIAVINRDGNGFTRITLDERYESSSPQWSTDGKSILFYRATALRKPWRDISQEERAQQKLSGEIMLMNADGSNIHNITSTAKKASPFWSHDGKTIYYTTHENSNLFFYKVKKGKEPKLLATLSGTIYSLDLSPNGKQITYAAEREKLHAIYIMDLKTKTEKKIIGD